MNNQAGVGLSEQLIALLISSLIGVGLMHQYLYVKQHYYRLHQDVERQIETQVVVDLIRNSVRQAGFTPCLGIDRLLSIDHRNHKRLKAVELGGAGEPAVRFNRMSENFDSVKKIIQSRELSATNRQKLHRQQVVVVADCYHAEVHEISSIQSSPSSRVITLTRPLHFTYIDPIYLGPWIEEAYFIDAKSDHRALFYQSQHAEELTRSIYDLSVSIKKYPWGKLVKVRLGLDNASHMDILTKVRTP